VRQEPNLPKQQVARTDIMVDRIAQALAKAEGHTAAADPARYRRLAIAALKPLAVPSEAMIDAAHQAVWFDAAWAINSRRDFRRAVRAMIAYAISEGDGSLPGHDTGSYGKGSIDDTP
jgi:hypothetical protein